MSGLLLHCFCGVCSYMDALQGVDETAYCGAPRQTGNDIFHNGMPVDQCIVCFEMKDMGCPNCLERTSEL